MYGHYNRDCGVVGNAIVGLIALGIIIAFISLIIKGAIGG